MIRDSTLVLIKMVKIGFRNIYGIRELDICETSPGTG